MNTDNVRLFSLPSKEEKIKSKNYIISWNFKKGFSASRTSIRRKALLRNFAFQPSNTQLLTPREIFFSSKKRFIVCFSLEQENSSQFTGPKEIIPIKHGESSLWILDLADNLKNQFINTARATFVGSSNIKKETKSVLFENPMDSFSTYKYKKYFSPFQLNLRQGCQLFTIYVVGSFSWLYFTQYSYSRTLLNSSKINFLFQEILYKNLPLLSEKEILLDQTSESLNPSGVKKSNLDTPKNSTYLNIKKEFKGIQLTPSFHEKLQNFIGKKSLNSNFKKDSVKELYFFARKPIFTKDLMNAYVSELKVSLVDGKPLIFQPKSVGPITIKENSSRQQKIHPSKKLLTQKKIYNFAGTSTKIDPEIDILPRKLEGGYKKTGLCVNKTKGISSFDLLSNKKLDHASPIKFNPLVDLDEKVLWCNTLIEPKKSNQSNCCFDENLSQDSVLKLNDYKNQKPLEIVELKTNLCFSKTWLTSNSFPVDEFLKKTVFTQNQLEDNSVFITKSKNPHKEGESKLTKSSFDNLANIELLKKDLLFPNSLVKKKKTLKSKGQKWIELPNQPRLHSGFNFPNISILKNNKSIIKEGLGLTINAQFHQIPINNGAPLEVGMVPLEPLKSPRPLNNKTQNNVTFREFESTNSTIRFKSKKFLYKNPFFEWIYQHHPESEYIVFNRVNEKTINLQKNSARFVALDKDNDILIGSLLFSGEKEKVIENVFSSKRKSFNGNVDAPENFFGTPYLKLGERFTIEKIKGKNQIGTLYNIHNGDREFSKFTNIIASPYASMGTSLNTVFGKKRFTVPQSKKTAKIQNLITNARLVMDWSKESKNLSRNSWSTKNLNENDPYFFLEKGQKPNKLFTKEDNIKVLKLLSFKRISGKVNRNIVLPFKYYNPGIKRDRNIEDTMLVLEGFKKSRLFPTIHNHYRGIAARGLPIELQIDKAFSNAQDIDLQSILEGMRQRTEAQRIAENFSDLSHNAPLINNFQKEETVETALNPSNSSLFKNKKKRLSNYYPLLSSLTVSPQTYFSPRVLGSTDKVDFNFKRFKDYKGSIQTKGFYFEKLLGSKSVRNFLENSSLISPNFLGKILFFTGTWYSYKLLATPLSQSTQFLPATFTEALGLQSFQQKYRIIKGDTGQSFKNIAGAEKTLSELRDLIWTFRLVGTGSPNRKHNFFTIFPYVGSRVGQLRSSVFSKSRNKFLLAGPPGTGKTLLVKALAAEANLPVIVQPVSGLRMISGVENPVSALFHVARQIKPCIIFLDELDTLGNDINASTSQNAEQKLGIRLARKYTYTLLLELDGLTSSTQDLLIIGATNRLDTLNPALTRAGRFETILDFNLPEKEVRTSLFSFYLAQSKTKYNLNNKKTSSKVLKQKKKYKNFDFTKTEPKSRQLESYLAKKCYGLSHASIGTIINESALESMYKGASSSKSLHTYETLERAINSVKRLTSKASLSTTFSTLNPQEENLFNSLSESLLESKNCKTSNKNSNVSHSIKLFQQEFLVSKVYQIIGSRIYCKKKKTGTLHDFEKPINRFDLQSKLLQEYSGIACLCIYNAVKPQSFNFLAGSGLYENPSYIATIILTLKILTLQSSCFAQDINQPFNDFNVNYSKNRFSTNLKGINPFFRRDDKLPQFSGFISENNLSPLFFSETPSNDVSSNIQKSMLFWNNRKTFKKSLTGSVGFTSHNNQLQPLLLDIKYNPFKSWFRIYLSRPFFRYDSFHYIENKEYYPKNNYILKRNTGFVRNVSTLSHRTIYIPSSGSRLIKNSEIQAINYSNAYNRSLSFQEKTLNKFFSKQCQNPGKFLKEKCFVSNFTFSGPSSTVQNGKTQSKESLYLAIVAKIFHQNIQFFKINRELIDYCAYIFLRYGMLYEFYLETIIKRF